MHMKEVIAYFASKILNVHNTYFYASIILDNIATPRQQVVWELVIPSGSLLISEIFGKINFHLGIIQVNVYSWVGDKIVHEPAGGFSKCWWHII